MARRTDHSELQQIEDEENSLALLFGRQDYRDYFEREGSGVYVQWRVPEFSTLSVHLREDTWRSLPLDRGTRSWFHTDRALRDNPSVDDGDTRTLTLRLERLLHRSAHRRAGTYHWLELERAGGALGGDFTYTRALADLRSVLRLSPASTLSLRAVAGSGLDGGLPSQKTFTLGGVDGLRGHRFAQYRGDQIALGQMEYTVGIWRMASDLFEGGLHAIVFVDTGRAWTNPDRRWDPARQKMKTDGGFGFSTSEDNVRVYMARDLQDPGSQFVVSMRLQRPF
jgi:outer membrane translocation and assembly module TamA